MDVDTGSVEVKTLRLKHEVFCFQGTSVSLTWSTASSEGQLVHRNFSRITGITGINVPDDLTRSRGYLTPQRETPSQKNRPLSQRYRSRRRNHAFCGQISQLFPGTIQELFTLRPNFASSDKCLGSRVYILFGCSARNVEIFRKIPDLRVPEVSL